MKSIGKALGQLLDGTASQGTSTKTHSAKYSLIIFIAKIPEDIITLSSGGPLQQ